MSNTFVPLPHYNFVPVGLDIETSTSDASTGELLSIGVVDFFNFENKAYYEVHHKRLTVEPEAMRVNKIDVCTLDGANKESLYTIDNSLFVWFTEAKSRYATNHIVPVGFNVGSFDMPFVRKYLPITGGILKYRSIDLNALCFARALQQAYAFDTVKKRIKRSAVDQAKKILPQYDEHNALFDAMVAVFVLQDFTSSEEG